MTTATQQLHPVTLTVNGKEQKYMVAVSDCKSWEDTLHLMVILNKHGKSVYRDDTHGNRVAILVNHLYMQNRTVYVTHNGIEFIYVPDMDVFVSRVTKKVVWEDKNDPQRKSMVHQATTAWMKKGA